MPTYYAVHDDTTIYGVGTADPETMRDDTAREVGYNSHAEMVAEGNRGFDVSPIDTDLALEIQAHGFSGGAFAIINGVIVRQGADRATTLRQFLVAAWGEGILDNPELTIPGADQDYDEAISAAYRHRENDGSYSYIVVAGDSAVISTPAHCWSIPAEDVAERIENEGDWDECPIDELPAGQEA